MPAHDVPPMTLTAHDDLSLCSDHLQPFRRIAGYADRRPTALPLTSLISINIILQSTFTELHLPAPSRPAYLTQSQLTRTLLTHILLF